MLPNPSIPLPEVPISEWNAIDMRTAHGLYVYRSVQADSLLDLPDYGGGDLNAEQRREALIDAVSLHRPLAALSLFLSVVALEDFVRDLIARMADNQGLVQLFPKLLKLRSQPKIRTPDQAFRRLDTDPAGAIDPEEINAVFKQAFGVAPIEPTDYWHLRDLALLRHTVAHHAAVIRQIDFPRFRHFVVRPGQMINPPVAFVKAESMYLYQIGRKVENAIRDVVFKEAISVIGNGWSLKPDSRIQELIEFFSYFGYIETTVVPVGWAEPGSHLRQQQEQESVRIKSALLTRCIADLLPLYGS